MQKSTDVAVIGGGQAGLAMSSCLSSAGIDHAVIERGRIGERWRSERWPSLKLLTPNWMTRLPGWRAGFADPKGFMSSGEFVAHLDAYGRGISAPVFEETEVVSVEAERGRFRIRTTSGSTACRAVVVATGACDRPAVPAWSTAMDRTIRHFTPADYRGPEGLPEGGVLVVGASATGAQLAREIRRSGRTVVLSAGRHVRAPRRYRGRDIFEWLDASGFLGDSRPPDADVVRLRSQPSLQLRGSHKDGELGLDLLASEGIRIVGRALLGAGTVVRLSVDLSAECAAAEGRRQKLLVRIDEHIRESSLAVPEDYDAWRPPAPLPATAGDVDLAALGVKTILWATGYRRQYPWLRLPVLDGRGEIVERGGVTPCPGLFALGLPFQRHRASAFIDGVGRDAEALAAAISHHLKTSTPLAA